MQPLVTVIIPVCNGAEFIAQTLESVRAQSYAHVEILVIDDGSTDDTAEIVDLHALRDPRVRRVWQHNWGPSEARNRGISLAQGRYLAFLDSDDLWHPEKISVQVQLMQAQPDLGGCYVSHRIIDASDHVIRSGLQYGISGHCRLRHMLAKPVGCGSNLLMRQELAVKLRGFDAVYDLTGCEDLEFELRLAELAPLAEIPLYLVGYRVHPNSLSRDKIGQSRGLIKVYRDALSRASDAPGASVRWILGRGYRSLAANLLKNRDLLAGTGVLFQSILMDPAYLLVYLSRQKPGRSATRRVTGQKQAGSTLPVQFGDMAPDIEQNRPSWIIRRRMEKLALHDAVRLYR